MPSLGTWLKHRVQRTHARRDDASRCLFEMPAAPDETPVTVSRLRDYEARPRSDDLSSNDVLFLL